MLFIQVKKLVIFICLLSLLVVPYAVVYRSILEGTEEFKLSVISGALYKYDNLINYKYDLFNYIRW